MSWQDKINTPYIITCGDGRQFNVLWRSLEFVREYNITEFEFQDVPGTNVQRREPKGRRYPLEIYFQGDDNVEQAATFLASADDPRPWKVIHPMYGAITVQPSGLKFFDENYNITVVTGSLLETNTGTISNEIIPQDKVAEDKAANDEVAAASFAAEVPAPGIADVQQMQQNVNAIYSDASGKIKDADDANAYYNLFSAANTAILNATAEPLLAIRKMQAMLNAPALFNDSVAVRMDMLKSQFDILTGAIAETASRPIKKLFENNAGCILSAMALAAVNPQDGDYENMNAILRRVEQMQDTNNEYVEKLDDIASESVESVQDFTPDFETQNGLNGVVDFTVSNLLNVAVGAKQERTVYLEADTNLIMATHRFLGLDAEDLNISKFIQQNQIGLNEHLQLRKGRKIVYYV